jgi:hypothetical protein
LRLGATPGRRPVGALVAKLATMVAICPQSLITTMFLLAAPTATPEAQNAESLVIHTDFAVLRRGPGRDTVLDALINTQAVLFRGDRCTRDTPETTYWTCEVDGVSMSGVVDSGTLKLDKSALSNPLGVEQQLRAAAGNGAPTTRQQERLLVLSSQAAYRTSAKECSRHGNHVRCDDALQTRINLFATAHALDGSVPRMLSSAPSTVWPVSRPDSAFEMLWALALLDWAMMSHWHSRGRGR